MIRNLVKLAVKDGGKISPSLIPGHLTDGTGLCNSSVFVEENGDIILNIRHVHYTLYHSEFDQKYWCGWGCLAYLNPEDDISLRTGNYLCKLDPETLYVKEFIKVDTSKHDIKPNWEFIGLEDARVMRWEGKLYISGVRRDIIDNGEGRMELCEIDWGNNHCKEITRDRILPPEYTYLEKNWMPILDMPYHYIKWTNPLEIVKVDPSDKTEKKAPKGKIITIPSKTVISRGFQIHGIRHQRGGSQVIPFKGGRMALLHECDFWYNENERKDSIYYHRFVFWDENWDIVKITEPFKFMDAQIEFGVGLAQKDNDLLISFGYQDNAAYILKMPIKTLDKLEYFDMDSFINFECKYPDFKWGKNERYLSKIINQEVFVDEIYEKHFKIKENDIVVDIGANVGSFTYKAFQSNPQHVYSIEPSSILYPTLVENTSKYKNSTNIRACIGDTDLKNKVLSSEYGEKIYDNVNAVYDILSFKTFIANNKIKKIDFLKCDCEGGEYFIFTKENKKWILDNIKYIAAEFHLWGVPDALDNFYKFRDLYLNSYSNYIVEDRLGNDVTSHMQDDQWLKDFSWGQQTRAQFNIYINNESR